MSKIIHIVAKIAEIRGQETHVFALAQSLRQAGNHVEVWTDTSNAFATQAGVKTIRAFGGTFPRGGNLILLGFGLSLAPWIDHVHPDRVILICNLTDSSVLYRTLAQLERPTLPTTELVYVSSRLRDLMGIPGYLCPTIVDLTRFSPRRNPQFQRLTIGRHSRDTPNKHHPDDPSLYRLLAWHNLQVRLMGATCIAQQMGECFDRIECLPVNTEPAHQFLNSLDIFYYRTSPEWHEASGRVVMEALASGLAVVAHTSGGYTDWIKHAENGVLFETREEAYIHLCRLHEDKAYRDRIQTQARVAAETLQDKSVIQNYMNWLTQ